MLALENPKEIKDPFIITQDGYALKRVGSESPNQNKFRIIGEEVQGFLSETNGITYIEYLIEDYNTLNLWATLCMGYSKPLESVMNVEPVSGFEDYNKKYLVYTRPSGNRASIIRRNLMSMDHHWLIAEIDDQIGFAQSQLSEIGFTNDSMFDYSQYSVEFVTTEYFEAYRDTVFNSNTIPFQKEAFSNNPQVYINNPDDWLMIVRFNGIKNGLSFK